MALWTWCATPKEEHTNGLLMMDDWTVGYSIKRSLYADRCCTVNPILISFHIYQWQMNILLFWPLCPFWFGADTIDGFKGLILPTTFHAVHRKKRFKYLITCTGCSLWIRSIAAQDSCKLLNDSKDRSEVNLPSQTSGTQEVKIRPNIQTIWGGENQ